MVTRQTSAAGCEHLHQPSSPAAPPSWLNILVLLFMWKAVKFRTMCPISVSLLVIARMREHGTTRYYEASSVGAVR